MTGQNPLLRVGREFAGPLFYGYVDWVLAQASLRGIKRLYLVARDGQVLSEIARSIVSARSLSLELRYLHGSRQAWRLPALERVDDLELEWILRVDPLLSVELIAHRLDLDPADLFRELERLNLKLDRVGRELDASEVAAIRGCLRHSETLRLRILASAAAARQRVLSYLHQEGLFEPVTWAMVDLGWYGNLQDALSRILSHDGCQREVTGFYFGLLRSGEGKHAYFFRESEKDEYLHWGRTFISHLEVLAAADHGLTTGYQTDISGKVVPLLKEQRNEAAISWGLPALRRGISEYCGDMLGRGGVAQDVFRPELLNMVRSFYTRPPFEIARVLGRFPFSSDQTETHYYLFAPPITLGEALTYLRNFHKPQRFKITFWIHGSKIQSGPAVRLLLAMVSRIFWIATGMAQRLKKGRS